MKLFEIPMVAMSLVGLCFVAGLGVPVAHADFTFGAPVNSLTDLPLLNPATDTIDSFSADGLEMYISSKRAGGQGQWDIWVCKRASPEDDWGPPENLGPVVNSSRDDGLACISPDGLSLYFNSTRSDVSFDLYVTKRATRSSPWGQAVSLGPKLNSPLDDGYPWISADGMELYFHSSRAGGYGGWDLYVCKRIVTATAANDSWGDPVNLGPAVNSPAWEACPCLSLDGLLLFFEDWGTLRPGGYGGGDLWVSRRASLSDPWGSPVNLGPVVNGPTLENSPRISPDGSALYFNRGGGTNWKAPILPVLDFNADGMIDGQDMDLLVTDWGENSSVCDIGPFAWGDGVVDEKDLKVLMESSMTPGSRALDVPCDVVLSWAGPSLARGYDVYFDTTFDDVNSATRDDPRGVLVSLEQSETTYASQGVLELNRTYYWRVDTVVDSPTTLIYRGAVVKFTTEVSGHRIRNITATASSATANMGSEKTVDGSGLDANEGHSTNGTDMWLSKSTRPHWIQFEFDRAYTLDELWVWNSNQLVEPFMGFGAKSVKIEYSTDGATWAVLEGVPEFARAPGQADYGANTVVSFGGVSAKYVRLTIESNWGGVAPSVGLSEVRFFYIPERPATQP